MNRRDFLRNSALAAFTIGTSNILGNVSRFGKFANAGIASGYDMAAVKGGEANAMFDKAIEALGGMKSFVKKGQTVLVKPNIGWDVIPENAANTNPLLIKRIIEHCLNAGAKEVRVFDHTCDNWTACYKNSGIEAAVKSAGGKMVPANLESYYQEVQVKKGKNMHSAKVHEALLSSDVFINVPILKDHQGSRVSIAMKNLMGVVWDRGFWHRNDLHQCIADFATFRKPDLNIIDAYAVMKQNGPRGISKNDIVVMKSQIVSRDIVAADAAAVKLYGLDPEKVNYVKMANELGAGSMNLDKLNIKKIIM
jgi:uncharacterized protein (DUF362 family)